MKPSILFTSLLASNAIALFARENTCCFKLVASGGANGPVGQLPDGQNRVGNSSLPPGTYCIDNGSITDGNGRGCILTPPTTQFQCDSGAKPTPGFGVNCDGTLTHDGGNTTFFACDSGSGLNIYTELDGTETGCRPITLSADNCKNCPAAPPPPPPAPKKCPNDLADPYEFPHLIVPVDSTHPDVAKGTNYAGQVTPNAISSLFTFDIPGGDAGKTCTLVFLLPTEDELQTSSFTMNGPGNIGFKALTDPPSNTTTWANTPKTATDFGVKQLSPGNAYTISQFACPAGKALGYEVTSSDTSLSYFQDYNPCPIGMYITLE